jgi:hypothetical protein
MIAVYRLASEKGSPCRILALHKNHPAEIVVFCTGGNENGAYAYKTIVLYASVFVLAFPLPIKRFFAG